MREYIPVLNLRRSRFAPRLAPTLLAAAAIVLFAALGNWQLGRAEEKRALAAKFGAGGNCRATRRATRASVFAATTIQRTSSCSTTGATKASRASRC